MTLQQAKKGYALGAVAVLFAGNFVTILDLFIVNVSMQSIRKDLGAGPAALQLIVVAYSATYGVFLINGARLGDHYGRKRVFLWGMALFTLASAAAGLAPSATFLIFARAFQGAGAAAMMPQVFASLRVLFEGHERKRAFALMASVQGVAASIAQLLGGLLIEHAGGWRSVFLVNVPFGIAALLLGRKIPETRLPAASSLDLRGAIFLGSSIALILVPMMVGGERHSPFAAAAGALVGCLTLSVFVRYERTLAARGETPIVDPGMFRNWGFVAGLAAVFLFYSSISSLFLALTFLLQDGLGLSPVRAGLIFTPCALAFVAGSRIAAPLAKRMGGRAILTGTAIFAAGIALSAAIGAMSPDDTNTMIVALAFNGAGQGIVIPLALEAVLSSVEPEHAGLCAGMVSTMQNVGSAVGVTIVGVLFFALTSGAAGQSREGVLGHAFAAATLYNLSATAAAFLLFRIALRPLPIIRQS